MGWESNPCLQVTMDHDFGQSNQPLSRIHGIQDQTLSTRHKQQVRCLGAGLYPTALDEATAKVSIERML